MNRNRESFEQLDSLLTDLEAEVLHSNQSEQHLAAADECVEGMEKLRSSIETLIRMQSSSAKPQRDASHSDTDRVLGVKTRTTQMLERLAHRVGMGQDDSDTGLSAQVRMAFSSEPEGMAENYSNNLSRKQCACREEADGED